MKIKLFVFLFVALGGAYNLSAQTSELSRQVKTDFNLKATSQALEYFYNAAIGGKNGRIKDKAKFLKAQATMVKNQSGLAYNRAKKLIERLENKEFYKLANEVSELKRDFYNLNYAANALIDVCDWAIKRPSNARNHYKSAEKAFNTMAKHFNNAQKHKHCITYAMALEHTGDL